MTETRHHPPSKQQPRGHWQSLAILTVYGLLFGWWLPWWPDWLLCGLGLVLAYVGWVLDHRYSQQWYQAPPLSNSLLFWLVGVPLALFVVTSTGVWLGQGLVLGWLVLVVWETATSLADPDRFQRRFLFHLQRPIAANEQRWLVGGLAAVLAVLTMWSWR